MKRFLLLPLLAAGFILAGCSDSVVNVSGDAADKKADTSGNNIVDLVLAAAAGDPAEFTILKAAVLAADPAVLNTLSAKGQLTVFAPTDAAFAALLAELKLEPEELLAQKELVTAVLLFHVANGRRYAADVITSDRIRMVDGNFAFVTEKLGGYYIDRAKIIGTDVETSNGVVHVIDQVILPPSKN